MKGRRSCVDRYSEKDNITSETILWYYLGDKIVALKKGVPPNTVVIYVHQEHLTSTSVGSNTGGASTGTLRFLPFGSQRSTSGAIPTDKKACAEPVEAFTGQRLDATGLYYYGARYYDPTIGRFISADSLVQNLTNPQALNRYSYTINNPLKYTDPTGRQFHRGPPRAAFDPYGGGGGRIPSELEVAMSRVAEAIAAEREAEWRNNLLAAGVSSISRIESERGAPLPLVTAWEGGPLNLFLNMLLPVNPSAVTVPPLFIISIGRLDDRTRLHELRHWEQADREGAGDFWKGYMAEIASGRERFGNTDDAYYWSRYEQEARIASGEQTKYDVPYLPSMFANEPWWDKWWDELADWLDDYEDW